MLKWLVAAPPSLKRPLQAPEPAPEPAVKKPQPRPPPLCTPGIPEHTTEVSAEFASAVAQADVYRANGDPPSTSSSTSMGSRSSAETAADPPRTVVSETEAYVIERMAPMMDAQRAYHAAALMCMEAGVPVLDPIEPPTLDEIALSMADAPAMHPRGAPFAVKFVRNMQIYWILGLPDTQLALTLQRLLCIQDTAVESLDVWAIRKGKLNSRPWTKRVKESASSKIPGAGLYLVSVPTQRKASASEDAVAAAAAAAEEDTEPVATRPTKPTKPVDDQVAELHRMASGVIDEAYFRRSGDTWAFVRNSPYLQHVAQILSGVAGARIDDPDSMRVAIQAVKDGERVSELKLHPDNLRAFKHSCETMCGVERKQAVLTNRMHRWRTTRGNTKREALSSGNAMCSWGAANVAKSLVTSMKNAWDDPTGEIVYLRCSPDYAGKQ